MAARMKNMTEGRPLPLIVSFALPLMAGNIFQQLYTVVDTMVVGKGLGVNALAALGVADGLNWMVLSIAQGLVQGFAILMAQEFGAGRMDKLRRVIGNSVMLAAVSAAVVFVLGQTAARPVLVLMQAPEEIMGGALLYLRIMFMGIPVIMLYNLLACILRSLGDGQTPLNAMIVASLVNIVLDLLFVLGFGWGIAGAAVATLIAQLVSSLFCLRQLLKIEELKLERSDLRPDTELMKQLFLLGLPMALQNMMIAVGSMIVQSVVNGFGVLFIAGFTATNKLYGLLEIAATSYGYAMITYVGQNLGAGRIDRIKKGMRAAIVVAIFTSLAISAVMLIFGKNILGLFISGTPEVVEQTLKIAYFYLAVMSAFLSVLYILHVTRSAIQGMGNTFLPMVSGIAEFVMRVATVLLLPLLIGEKGLFFVEIMAWTGADVILIPSYFWVLRKAAGSGKAVDSGEAAGFGKKADFEER